MLVPSCLCEFTTKAVSVRTVCACSFMFVCINYCVYGPCVLVSSCLSVFTTVCMDRVCLSLHVCVY